MLPKCRQWPLSDFALARVSIPDHGEVWSLPWEANLNNEGVNLVVRGVRLPYVLKKTCKLIGEKGLRINYPLEKLSCKGEILYPY